MAKLILRELTDNDEQAFLDGLKDWEGEDLSWYSFVWQTGMKFSDHLEILQRLKNKNNLEPGRVPSSMYYAFVENKIVGRLSLRHELNKNLLERGGHLGYAVNPIARGKGYATEIYKQGLEFCRELGVEKILVTCSEQNIASWKVIEKFPAQLENRFYDNTNNEFVRRYWVNINENPSNHIKIPNFNIRAANPADAISIAQIYADSWRSTYKGIVDQDYLNTLNREQFLAGVNNRLSHFELSCFVAENIQTSKIVGFAEYGPCREKSSDADCELYAIYLLKEYQRFNAGRLLFEIGLQKLKELKFEKMMVSVLEKNKVARSFYEKLGGKNDGLDYVEIQDVRYSTVTYSWKL